MKFILILAICFSFVGCINDWDKKLDEKTIDTEVLGKTNLFSTKTVRLKITEYKNLLTISLDYKLPKNINLPVDSFYGDTLIETRFFLKLYSKGKPLTINNNVIGYKGFFYSPLDTNIVIIPFEKQNIIPVYHSEISIPMYIFHNLKVGKQTIEGELFARKFYGSHYDKETKETTDLEIETDALKGKIKFKIDIPEIYLTTIYGKGLDLRNDAQFSPLGMDFSFREGYPDIYWEIYSPATSESDFSFPYWRSVEARNATSYDLKDTVYLYHFSNDAQFKIGVYDRDDLSRDDFLGDWYGSVKAIVSDKYKILQFDKLKWFQIKAEQLGCINKK